MIKQPRRWFIISSLTMVLSLILIVVVQPHWGIDFTGGTLLEVRSTQSDTEVYRQLLQSEFDLESSAQTTEAGSILIRTSPLDQATHERVVTALRERNLLQEELRFESIGPTIGQELTRKAGLAITFTVIILIAYLAYNFRQAAGFISAWKFGVAAVVALVHDLLLVTAVFVLLGKFFNATIDTLFVTALLAILSYSINDTIVLFNRFKEEWLKHRSADLTTALDTAARTTIIRSLNTSLTILLVLITLLIFGGDTIRWFIVALAAGTITGTYSSLFVAPPWLHALAKR